MEMEIQEALSRVQASTGRSGVSALAELVARGFFKELAAVYKESATPMLLGSDAYTDKQMRDICARISFVHLLSESVESVIKQETSNVNK